MNEDYAEALGLPKRPGARKEALIRALDRAHDLRKFEIENYWKRATYFWLFQAAAWTTFGVMAKDGGFDRVELLLPCGLGAATAAVAFKTAQGSKFWQENWEAHVDELEETIEGRLTQVILMKSPLRASVSRVNERLLHLLLVTWLALFAGVALGPLIGPFLPVPDAVWRIGGLIALLVALWRVWFGLESGMTGQVSLGSGWKPWSSRTKNPSILWRDTAFKAADPKARHSA